MTDALSARLKNAAGRAGPKIDYDLGPAASACSGSLAKQAGQSIMIIIPHRLDKSRTTCVERAAVGRASRAPKVKPLWGWPQFENIASALAGRPAVALGAGFNSAA